MSDVKCAIGLMSGTSMDGIDVAILRTDGDSIVEHGPSAYFAYDASQRAMLQAALVSAKQMKVRTERPDDLAIVEEMLTLAHVEAVQSFLRANALTPSDIDLIGFHGQTVLHRPDEALTVQLGDGALLAERTGIDVVYDMRANDMVHGGQGAPLIPAYHAALSVNLPQEFERPAVFVNVGGISNLTYIGEDGTLAAFDSGPGNMLIDQWVELHTGKAFDEGGKLASTGVVDASLIGDYLASGFFSANQRRSLDRGDFLPPEKGRLSLEDGARSLSRLTGEAILKSATYLPSKPKTYVVCGGGRLNPVIMAEFTDAARAHGAKVVAAEAAGFDGGAMEAEAWAYLAVRSLRGLPLTYPGTTGVDKPVAGGVFAKA